MGALRLALMALTVTLIFGPGCGRLSASLEEGAARSVSFEPGVPNFALDAIPYVDGPETGVDVSLGAPRAAFVFTDRDDAFEARVEIVIRILDRQARRIVREESWTDTLRVTDFHETQSFDRWTWGSRLAVAAGGYVVEVVMENVDGGEPAVRRERVTVHAAENGAALLGIRMSVRRGDEPLIPFAGMHLAAGYDSLRAAVQLVQAPALAEVEMRLMRLPRDTSVAAAPFYFSPAGWTLPRIGIDYGEAELVQRTLRRLDDPIAQLEIFFSLPPLDPGSYRVEVTARASIWPEARYVEREFSVMPPGYPEITTLEEMIEGLVYIAREREMEHIREGEGPQERRARFDAFWGSLFPNRQRAAEVMRQYYSRIEEANVLFSTFKEGWKTDRGMVFIVQGAPAYREIEPSRELWRYSYTSRIIPVYEFERYFPPDLNAAYEQFTLRRAPEHEQFWLRGIDRWREGRAR